MDTLRGSFGAVGDTAYDAADDAAMHDSPPPAPASIGQDERRMQVRAYNHWASLLEDRTLPSIEDLDPDSLPDFGPYSVLLDFTSGIENPGISYLGDKLAEECGTLPNDISSLDDVPSRSLLSRITDHYMQILANQAPIGFEAEFVNQRNRPVLYRGILLPFSSDDDTIDFIYGVINWKELDEPNAADELLLEIDQALEVKPPRLPLAEEALTDWADGPSADNDDALPRPSFGFGDIANAIDAAEAGTAEYDAAPAYETVPEPGFAAPSWHSGDMADELADDIAGDISAEMAGDMALADWLAAARDSAAAAHVNEDRTRSALYAAIGQAYDFSLAAADAPEEFDELLIDAGLTVQERAPMTPVVKLVFGADYDKTRLTEYACALTHAHRLDLPQGQLATHLRDFDGGLKGLVKEERRLRKEEAGKPATPADGPRKALAKKLRALPAHALADLAAEGSEFALVMIRRSDADGLVVLGEVPDDAALVEKAARKLIG
ncbi:MAG: hypothetical protein WA842_11120 [Croceibacterium sp.]